MKNLKIGDIFLYEYTNNDNGNREIAIGKIEDISLASSDNCDRILRIGDIWSLEFGKSDISFWSICVISQRLKVIEIGNPLLTIEENFPEYFI